MKHSNDTFGKGTRDLPAFGAVPQPIIPLRAHFDKRFGQKIGSNAFIIFICNETS